jgi:3-hexulose-6-phosphate synthase
MFWHCNIFGGMLMALLQLALDFTNLQDAIDVAKKAKDYVDWIEAGTPLIKSCGMSSIRALKKEFPEKKIVADMKIMDTGALEVRLASDAGADVITVMAAADLSTVSEAIAEGRRLGKIVVVDTIGAEPTKVEEIECMAPDYICPHVGIDQQRRGVKLEDEDEYPNGGGRGHKLKDCWQLRQSRRQSYNRRKCNHARQGCQRGSKDGKGRHRQR